MMHSVRAWLTTGPAGLPRTPLRVAPAVLFSILASALWAGCAGGQSGSEGLCPEGMIERTAAADAGSTNDAFGTFGSDEDGGVEMDPDADATLVANIPEGSDGPLQCVAIED